MPRRNRQAAAIRPRTKAQRRVLRQANTAMSGPAPGATNYRGPLRPNWNRSDQTMITITATQAVEITTDGTGTGTFNPVFNSNDVVSQDDFKTLATLYEEFRVCAITAHFVPKVQYADPSAAGSGSGTEQLTPFLLAPWRENASAFSSFQQAASQGGSRQSSANRSLTHSIRADEVDLMQYHNTGGTGSVGEEDQYGLKTYLFVSGGPASSVVQFGFVTVYFAVQFRTRSSIGATLLRRVGSQQQQQAVAPPEEKKDPPPQWVLLPAAAGTPRYFK